MSILILLPIGDFGPEMLQTLTANLRAIEDLLAKHITAINIEDGALGTALYADASVTTDKIADGVSRIASGSYTGDDAAGRIIVLGFRPRYVKVLRHDDSKEFYSADTGLAQLYANWRDSAGTVGTGAVNWQGTSATGFTVGSGAASTSNATGVTYSYVAWR